MPSPLGHALAGAAIGFLAQPSPAPDVPARPPWWFPVLGGLVAALPDADLLIPGLHRRATHSVTATVVVFIVAIGVTRRVAGRIDWRLSAMAAATHASHLLLDWLGADPFQPAGLQLFWPWSERFHVSGLDWFPRTERRLFENPDALAINSRAFFAELFYVLPITWLAWRLTRRRRSRIPPPTSGPEIPPPPSA